MSLTLAEKNSLLRDAVSARLDRKLHREEPDVLRPVTPSDLGTSDEETQHVTFSYDAETMKAARDFVAAREEFKGFTQQPVTVAEQTLQGAIEAVRDRHTKYGPPVEHFSRTAALVNAAFGTNFTPADWALVMVLDKVARLRGPTPTTDGGIDIAGYGSCYEECRSCG
jgi:hypothetical protein